MFRVEGGSSIPLSPEEKTARFVPGFLTLIKGLNLWLFSGVVLAYPVHYLFVARRWQWLLRTHALDPGFWQALRLTWIGILMNNVFPSSTGGDLVKGWCIFRRAPVKRLPAVMTVLVDRVLGLVSLMLIGTIAIILQTGRPELAGISRTASTVLLAILVSGLVFFSGRLRRLLRVEEIVARLPMSRQIQNLDNSLFHYRQHLGVLGKCVAISMAVHIWTIVAIYYLAIALGVHIKLVDFFIFMPIIWTSGAVAPTIAGLGVIELLFQQFFSMPGVGATPSSAVALCVLYRITVLLSALPGAVPTYQELSGSGVALLSHPSMTLDENEGEIATLSAVG